MTVLFCPPREAIHMYHHVFCYCAMSPLIMKCFHPSFYLRESEALVPEGAGCKTLRKITA